MENRHYSHEFQSLEKSVYREITPSILDVPPIRKGVDLTRKNNGNRFGLALNLYLFKDDEVEFSLLPEGFLRMKANHKARRFGNQIVAHQCVYFFYVPKFVNKDRIVVEWYDDHLVYICERVLKPVYSVFGPTEKELRELMEEEATEVEEITLDAATSDEKESTVTEVAGGSSTLESDVELVIKDASVSMATEVADESSTVEIGVELPATNASFQEVSTVTEVAMESSIVKGDVELSKDVSGREVSTLAEVADEPSTVDSDVEVEEDASAQGVSTAERIVKEASSQTESGIEIETEGNRGSPTEGEKESLQRKETGDQTDSLDCYTKEIRKLFLMTDQEVEGRILKPIFVNKNYREPEIFDLERLMEEQKLKNKSLQHNVLYQKALETYLS